MSRRFLRRSLAVGASGVAAGVIAAAPAYAATTPSSATPTVKVATVAANSISANSELLNGTVNDNGRSVQWTFEYGTSTKYGRATPVHTLRAKSGNQTVSMLVSHLRPKSKYHFRLVVIAGNGSGATRISGKDMMFKSGGTGVFSLGARIPTLTSVAGRLGVPLACNSSIACRGKFSIGTRTRVARTKKLTTIVCVAGRSFLIRAHKTFMVRAKLLKGCAALLKKKKRIRAKITSYPRSGQHALIRMITLVYRP